MKWKVFILLLSFEIVMQLATAQDTLVYHLIRTDNAGKIIPWNSDEPGTAYDDVLHRVWQFWKNIETDSNGEKYYMNHQVWSADHDKRGLGGDQLMMALSSWDLYYNYTGDTSVLTNIKYIADYYLAHSLSPPDSKWPDLPFPYNMNVEAGIYDGDMILGKDFLQPDKAGSFGYELIHLFNKTNDRKYLDAAIKIANTLADKVKQGDENHSPWPFKVNAITGDTGLLVEQEVWYEGMEKDLTGKQSKKSTYTTSWTGTLGMFDELVKMKAANAGKYINAYRIVYSWMLQYPVKNNKWGPFFEDVPRWSDTQINATTFAMYLLQHHHTDAHLIEHARNIIRWVYDSLGNKQYDKYGVTVINEQTAYPVPGNSHTARQASVDLMYAAASSDTALVENAIRQLNWATYMVDNDGKNFYPTNAIWMTDGYGDYVRHFIRAMAAAPQLAPNRDVLLNSTSIIRQIQYGTSRISYTTYDNSATEIFRMNKKPLKVQGASRWHWKVIPGGGVLTVERKHQGKSVTVFK